MVPDTEGLHPIANTAHPDLKADIVFVHGLSGGAGGTWRYGIEGKPGYFFWPEALGADLPDCAVWSLGYAAGISHWFGAPGMSIQDRAKNLVLKLRNRGLDQRPLIFITHSMGGLEVKEIIVRSQTSGSDGWKQLVGQVRGIVFCGTPHRGAHLASAAKILANYLRSQEHLQQMEMGCPLLDSLHEEFIVWQRQTGVAVESYVEKTGLLRARLLLRPLPLGLVVPSESGNPHIAGCECHPISADHITLVKPANRESDIYGGVLRFIQQILSKLPPTLPPTQEPTKPETPAANPIPPSFPIDLDRLSGVTETPHFASSMRTTAACLKMDTVIDSRSPSLAISGEAVSSNVSCISDFAPQPQLTTTIPPEWASQIAAIVSDQIKQAGIVMMPRETTSDLSSEDPRLHALVDTCRDLFKDDKQPLLYLQYSKIKHFDII